MKHVEELVARGVYESDAFDLKETLPIPADDKGKHRLRKACAGFANSKGGFLIFGVSNDSHKPQVERIVGLDGAVDFPAQFGEYPARCEPAVAWQLKTPALALSGTNRFVHIVQIPQSWKAPHAVADGDGWVFPKRTSKGTEPMPYSEVQSMFLGYYEKRLKLQLLRAELFQLSQAKMLVGLVENENNLFFSHLPTFELRVLETVLSDTYSITHEYPAFLGKLEELRTDVRSLNSVTETLRLGIALYPGDGGRRVATYGSTLTRLCGQIEQLANAAIIEIDKIVGEGQPKTA